MKRIFCMCLFVTSNTMLGQNLLKLPDYKKRMEMCSNISEKFAVSMGQNNFTDPTVPEWSAYLARNIKDYLNSDLIDAILIDDNLNMNKVVIGNEVFGVGSTLEFPDKFGNLTSPVPEVRIYIRSITKKFVEFGFSHNPKYPVPISFTNDALNNLVIATH